MSEFKANNTPIAGQGIGQAILLYCICLGLLLTVGIAAQTISIGGGLIITLLGLVLLPAVIFVRLKGLPILQGLRCRTVSPLVLVASLLIGAGAWSLAVGVAILVTWVIGPMVEMGLDVETLSDYLIILLIVAVLPGICEECLFRGAIQGVLERRGPWFAVLVSALLFGMFHLDPWRILPAALLGAVFGWLTYRTQSILPAIAAHFANNAMAISVSYFFRDAAAFPNWMLPALGLLFVVSMGLFLSLTRFPGSNAKLNPLSQVAAGLPTPINWLCGLFLALFSLMIAGITFLVVAVIAIVEMNDDALLPHIKAGDQLILIRNGSFNSDISPGDTVSFKRGTETWSRVVIRVDGKKVILRDGDDEIEVSLNDVIGEMIQIIPN